MKITINKSCLHVKIVKRKINSNPKHDCVKIVIEKFIVDMLNVKLAIIFRIQILIKENAMIVLFLCHKQK